MSTIFTKIINGEIPCEKLAEDDRFFSFLDIRPIHEGHTLVIPKREIDYIFDLDDDLLAGVMHFARPIAAALKAVVPCKRIGIMVAGIEVPHAHVHLVPISDVGDLNFGHARAADPAALAALAEKIRDHL
ncbi:MAG: HIT family protein [Verrucomicrobia bacterium]|nr:HIT family protein [Verrucomicrobiota bacterium]MDA1085429.1 HIT family protein [Verrucomicrobiota bacterium]